MFPKLDKVVKQADSNLLNTLNLQISRGNPN